MTIETYERLRLDVTEFDAEDIITSSVPDERPPFTPGADELPMPVGL